MAFPPAAGRHFQGHLLLSLTVALVPFFTAPSIVHPEPGTRGMLVRSYGLKSGLPSESVAAIAQTTDYYLWMCCGGTVVRFNGHSFVSLADIVTVGAAPRRADVLHADEEGNLWMGSAGALYRYRDGACQEIALPEDAAQEEIRSIGMSKDGTLRILTTASVYGYDGESVSRYGDQLGMPYTVFHCALERPDGSLWLGTNGGLLVAGESLLVAHTPAAGFPAKIIVQMLEGVDETVWLGTDAGVVVVDEDGSEVARHSPTTPSHRVRVLRRDRSGAVWVGTHGRGLSRMSGVSPPGSVEATYLEDAIITDLMEDVEGNFWVGTLGNGLYRLRAAAVSLMTTDHGLPSSLTSSVHHDAHGTLWVGTLGGLADVRRGKVRVYGASEGLPTGLITGLYEDSQGVLWVGTQDRWAFRLSGGAFEPAGAGFKIPNSCVVGMCEAADGALWIANRKNVLRLRAEEPGAPWQSRTLPRWEEVTAIAPTGRSDIWLGTSARLLRVGRWGSEQIALAGEADGTGVNALCPDGEGGLWVGTQSGALHYVFAGQAIRFEPSGKTPGTILHDIVVDSRGRVWLRTDAGVVRASAEEIHDVINGEQRLVRWTVVGPADGLPTTGLVKPGFPTACYLPDDRMVFATLRGLAFVEPSPRAGEEPEPPVVIERVLADDALVRPGRTVFGPGSRKFAFTFAALTYRDPESTRYRYRLLGFQDGWVDAGDSRTTTFLGIPPGSYTFEATAAAVSGVWSDRAARFSFRIKPHLYETIWFQTAGVVAAGAVALLLHRARIYRIEQRRVELEHLVTERTEQLRAANERLEELTVTDALTGIANRRRFKDMVDLEWRRSARSGTHMALVMMDIDWFKLYNDTYGHWAGDQCLRNVARTFDELVQRPGDLVARYGGEEFVAILAATDRDRAKMMAEQMRLAIEALQIPHATSPTGQHLTVSFGVAATIPKLGEKWEGLLTMSDQALYKAKQSGRNRVAG